MTVNITEHLWITLKDGTRLGARLWLPEGAEANPVPAVLEYIPYRKRDGTRGRDEPMHGYFAQNGYAAIRVDMRGTGESDGHMADEYIQQEQDDALEVIAWIAEQPWCSGNVGMMGKSWGGFNGLQVAACRPPALKAIITAYSTDDRFRDDIHYMGGLLLNDNLWWGTIMLAYQSRPLDPAIVGAGWRDAWIERLERLPFFPALWLEHQHYDEYWKHGSVCEDWSAIQCPVLAIGAWADSYTNAVPRLLENLQVPARGIIGPWGHVYPQDGLPGPAIGFLQEAVRWWDQWLKGKGTGIMDEPKLRAYVCDTIEPTGSRYFTNGRWVGEQNWPSTEITPKSFALGADFTLGKADAAKAVLSISSPNSHGKAGGEWMATGCPGEHPTDQRLDDGGSLNFDTPVLTEDLEILGAPVARLTFTVDQPVAQVSLRLSDVLPDGRITRVSYQVFNLNHINGHDKPEMLVPGKTYEIAIKLNDSGYSFKKGHRIRLSVATGYWPMVWPSPKRVMLTLDTATSVLDLPVRLPSADDAKVSFQKPAHGPATPMTQLDPGSVRRWTEQDHVTGETLYVTEGIGGLFGEGILRFDDLGTQLSHSLKRELRVNDNDPLSASYVLTQAYQMGREGWMIDIESTTKMHSDAESFYISGVLTAKENGGTVKIREWNQTIPRDHL
ncbi:CocE/NonD family hydrolase [Brucella anthropi]|uniref:CocE/NonD family hydrolase n=1 Tax=Brucella anthropi TaxID=529 RepID=UPI000CFAB6B2|nr:CocE/NonD family hydrolase [Ochrobactrum sp. MYb49]MCR5942269.1 CocE/NonD family hydrolase [Ochrobactrum sp. XJ1]PQZ64073.1 peptidase S15 [Ochrobactrum sp. MYb49]